MTITVPVGAVVVFPAGLARVPAVPTVRCGGRWRCVVVAYRVGVDHRTLGVIAALVLRLGLRMVRVLRLWLRLRHATANAGACSTTDTGTQNGTVATSCGLANGGSGRASNGSAKHGAPLRVSVGTDGGTGRAADSATNHRTLAPTHLLAQHRTGCRADSTTQQGSKVVGMGGGTQCGQGQRGTGHEACQAQTCRSAVDRGFQHS